MQGSWVVDAKEVSEWEDWDITDAKEHIHVFVNLFFIHKISFSLVKIHKS